MKHSPAPRRRFTTKRSTYKKAVLEHTRFSVETHPHLFPRTDGDTGEPMEVHHRISIHRCFNHGVPAVVAGSIDNLVAIPRSENRRVGVNTRPTDQYLVDTWRARGWYI